jgi:transcriptional regulator with XRE-family HTH domain
MDGTLRSRVAAEVRAEVARQQKTQQDLAEILGLPQQAISLRLNAKRAFRAEELVVLAEALGVPVDRFLRSDAPASAA